MKIIILMLLILTLVSCEQTVNDFELPYKEEIVLEAAITAGEPFDLIKITKTLHPLEKYSFEKAKILDAKVKIYSQNDTFELAYFSEGFYSNNTRTVEENTEYKIEVEWNGKKVSAVTKVPKKIDFDSIQTSKLNTDEGIWYNWIAKGHFTISDSTVCLVGNYSKGNGREDYYMYEYTLYKNNGKPKSFNYQVYQIYSDIKPETKHIRAFIETYPREFEKYYNTRNNGNSNDGIFSSTNNMKGNVTGDGFGYFYGRSRAEKEIKF